jgi:aminopeptidase N
LILDFNEDSSKLKFIHINGKKESFNFEKEHIIISHKNQLVFMANNIIDIFFDAWEKSFNRNDEFLYTLLVPDRASALFPCFE